MKKPTIHLICNAHLDPVWQWRWEEGCGEAMSTFGNAVDILREHTGLIFNHNEAVLYRWVMQYDPPLFREIQKLVKKGRWCVSGGWYLQPDVNMPGTESIIRQIAEGRRFFLEHFNARPVVAYNFDSFGHSGGLPQILRLAGYAMYIHMRPQEPEQHLPSDLYRWRGVDGTEILTYRIAVGLYHTEYDNIEQRLQEGAELALSLNRDIPVFWGIGNHGGGATREALQVLDAYVHNEHRVRILHSTPELLYRNLKSHGRNAPVVEGDLQRAFTGCYTSLSRLKRRAQRSLGELVQAESLCTAAWWLRRQEYPGSELQDAWRDHLFNDFHDILPGSCTEPAEQDALDQYGRVSETLRRLRLSAVAAFNAGKTLPLYVPITVLNTNPSCSRVPVEVECMLGLRPKWSGTWHLRLYGLDGKELPSQEEQPESLLPFNGWRRKICFMASLPHIGIARYEARIIEGAGTALSAAPALQHRIKPELGLVESLDAGDGRECLGGELLRPLVVEDDGDSWGSDRWSYRTLLGQFQPVPGKHTIVHKGPIRTISETVMEYGKSMIVLRTIAYPEWPVLQFIIRIHWNEVRKRLKLSIPTVFRLDRILCEVPGGALYRPADGQEHVHGRWCLLEGLVSGRSTAFALAHAGQHGLDFKDGEIRLSVLRSAAYCHEQGFRITEKPARKYMDQGVHEIRLLVTAGDAAAVRASIAGLADWLNAPPVAYAHLPVGTSRTRLIPQTEGGGTEELLSLHPPTVRLLACAQSPDGKALLVRLQEIAGERTAATLKFRYPLVTVKKVLRPFEIKTIQIERSGSWEEV